MFWRILSHLCVNAAIVFAVRLNATEHKAEQLSAVSFFLNADLHQFSFSVDITSSTVPTLLPISAAGSCSIVTPRFGIREGVSAVMI